MCVGGAEVVDCSSWSWILPIPNPTRTENEINQHIKRYLCSKTLNRFLKKLPYIEFKENSTAGYEM